jgi:hypothetical protein
MPWIDSSLAVIGFGALMVGMSSWSRFDEPSYDTQSEHFSRYKPRFSTSYRRYAHAKCGYVLAIVLLYLLFSSIPDIYNVFVPGETHTNSPVFPLAVALGLNTVQMAPGIKDLERRIRGFLHAMARIPEGLRRTVSQMRGSPFVFRPEAVAAQTRKLGFANGAGNLDPEAVNRLLVENDVVHTWYSVGCMLIALREENQTKTGIDPLFFDYYRDELESIKARHVALAVIVREYLDANVPALATGDNSESADLREIRDLRDRLYTFVACGVHSSAKTDVQRYEIVKKLGFVFVNPPDDIDTIRQLRTLAGLSFIAIAILSMFMAYTSQSFCAYVLKLDPFWMNLIGISTDTSRLLMSTWSTAAFYFAAILGALAVRNIHVSRREWFDVNNLRRERPILRYVTPTLVGTMLGCIVLTTIAFFQGPGFSRSFGDIGKAFFGSLPWLPLAMLMGFIAVWFSDSQFGDGRLQWRTILVRSIYGALGMAFMGFLTTHLHVFTIVQGSMVDVPNGVRTATLYWSLFLGLQIALIALVLCIIVQLAELYSRRTRLLAGQLLWAVTRQGPVFSAIFRANGHATLFGAGAQQTKPGPFVADGEWQQFPEGIAVRWQPGTDGTHCSAGDFGLISKFGDSLIYEGFSDQFGGEADFVAQIEIRASASTARREPSRAIAELTPSASVPLQPAALDAPALAAGG